MKYLHCIHYNYRSKKAYHNIWVMELGLFTAAFHILFSHNSEMDHSFIYIISKRLHWRTQNPCSEDT